MAENIVISVKAIGADKVLGSLTSLQTAIQKINSTPVTVNIRTFGADKKSLDALSQMAAAEASVSVAREKTKQVTQQRIISENDLARSQEKVVKGQKEVKSALDQTTLSAKKQGDTFSSLYTKVLTWGIVTSAVYAPIRAFKEVLETLKEVDSELVNIQKVTDMTDDQMAELTERAYSVASAYGRTATEVLSAETAFARAGYGEQIETLAELAVLLQNIGDVSADTANSFLLAVDAAWRLGGSESKLMQIMDGLNEITNKNATDMDKLASGMTVAASIFAESGESVQTFAALVGTGTAVTQRSGSEIARGLRTILMNIRQIRGETEDGELIDGESIANASKALKDYAGISTMTNGELRLASDILADLAEKWESLGTVAQSAIAEALAGKRQANVLTSIMSSWDMVEKMMTEYAQGAGSALRENEIYLDSWEAKSKRLSSTWTEFVSHLVETDVIKNALDVLIGLIEALDSSAGKAVISVVALTAALSAMNKTVNSVNAGKFANFFYLIGELLKGEDMRTVAALFKEGFAGIGASLKPLLPFLKGAGIIGGGIAAFSALTEYVQYLDEAYEREESRLYDLKTELDSLTAEGGEYYQLMTAGVDTLTDAEKTRLNVLQAQVNMLKEQLDAQTKLADETWMQSVGIGDSGQSSGAVDALAYNPTARSFGRDVDIYNEIAGAIGNVTRAYEEGEISAAEYYGELANIYDENEELLEQLNAHKDDLTVPLAAVLAKLSNIPKTLGEGADAAEDAAGAAVSAGSAAVRTAEELSTAMEGISASIDTAQEAYNVLTQAVAEYNGEGYLSLDTLQQLLSLSPEHLRLLQNENGQLVFNKEAWLDLTAAKIDDMAVTQTLSTISAVLEAAQAGNADAVNMLTAATNDNTAATWDNVQALLMELATMEAHGEVVAGTTRRLKEYYDSIKGWAESAKAGLGRGGGVSASTTSAAALPGVDNEDKIVASLEDQISLLNSEISLMEARGASSSELIEMQRKLQDLLHGQAQRMREIGEDQEEINKLSEQWWNTQKEIAQLYIETYESERELLEDQIKLLSYQGASASEIIAIYREHQDSLHEQAEYLRSIGASISEINDLSIEWWEDMESIEDILDDLVDEMSAYIDDQLDKAAKVRDEQIAAIDAQIEALEKERDIEDEKLTLKEKQKAVTEAEIALINAQNERTIRIYNAASKSWEWIADAQTVKDAKEAFDEAKQELSDYQKELALDAQIEALEAQKDDIEAAYDAFEAEWERIRESLEEPSRDIADILADIAENATPELKKSIEAVAQMLSDLSYFIGDTLDFSASFGSAGGSEANKGSVADVVAQMKENSQGWFGASDTDKAALHTANQQLGASIGATYSSDGHWYKDGVKLYDGGGILKGIGGIKATREDEIVLPPRLSERMLSPVADRTFLQRIGELSYLFGAGRSVGSPLPAPSSVGGAGSVTNNGGPYYINGVEISQRDAEGMSVARLAQLTRRLSIYRGAM